MIRIPPGIIDNSYEFFVHEGSLFYLHQWQRYQFKDLPEKIRNHFVDEMKARPEIMDAFYKTGIFRLSDQLHVYMKCMYGGFDHQPDLVIGGVSIPDNHSCNCSGHCCLKGTVKNSLPVKHGRLTSKQIEIVKLLAQNYSGKMIAAKLKLSEHTVNKHKHNIFRLTGCTTNVELAVWATNIKLI